jgi:hypothetical protein
MKNFALTLFVASGAACIFASLGYGLAAFITNLMLAGAA